MSRESEMEGLVKLHLNTFINYLVNEKKCNYSDALRIAVGSETYHRLLASRLYRNQGRLYVLDDFKAELQARELQNNRGRISQFSNLCIQS